MCEYDKLREDNGLEQILYSCVSSSSQMVIKD